jgi:hypothetical protein
VLLVPLHKIIKERALKDNVLIELILIDQVLRGEEGEIRQ